MLQSLPVAKNITKNPNVEYYSIQEAINAVAAGTQETIQILRNKTLLATETFNIPNGKNIIIDLNGCVISTGVEKQITNNGILTLIDSSTDANKVGGITSTTNYAFYNKGTATINGGSYSAVTHTIENEGTLTINNANTSFTSDNITIYNNDLGNITINNGIFDSKSGASIVLQNSGTGNITINNGTFTSLGQGTVVLNDSSGIVDIVSGTYNGNGGVCIDNKLSGAINITGGSFNTTSNTHRTVYGIFNEGSGQINISNVSINSEKTYGIYNKENGTITINSGTFSNDSSNHCFIYNNSSGAINVAGGSITSAKKEGIYNHNGGALTITGGTITGTIGILNHGTGDIIIGVQDGETNAGIPSITGTESFGVSSANKEFSFYGGTILGTTDGSINGGIKEYDTNCDILRTDNGNGTETTTLSKNLKLVRNLTTNTEYADLNSAITAASNNDTLQLLRHKSYASTEDVTTIPSGKSINIDINGFEIYLVKDNSITNNGTLTILDSNVNKKGLIKNYKNSAIYNKGTLNIQSGTIEGAYQSVSNNVVDLANGNAILNEGTLNITGGKVKSISTAITNTGTVNGNGGTLDAVACIYNNEGGTIITQDTSTILMNGTYGIINNSDTGSITYNNGTISTTTYGIQNKKTCDIEVFGGKIETTGSKDSAIINEGAGTVIIDGTVEISSHGFISTYASPAQVLSNNSTGKIKVSNATITLTNYGNSIYLTNGEIEINRCIITGNILQNGGGTLKVLNNSSVTGKMQNLSGNSTIIIEDSNVTYTLPNSSDTDPAIYNLSNNSNFSLINSNVILLGNHGSSSNAVPAIKNSGGSLTIEGGSVKAEGDNTYAIDNSSNLIVGNKDRIYDDSKPDIFGNLYGINNNTSGTLKFYDGIIKSNNKAISGEVAEVEDDYKLSITNIEKEARLTPSGTTQAVATIGSMNFMSLQLAVDSITTGTIDIRTDIELSAPVDIPAGKNITINKNGYSVTYNGSSTNAFNIESGATLTLNN